MSIGPKINEAYRANFNTLLQAAANGDLALVSCLDQAGKPVMAVCAMQVTEDGDIMPVPLAKLFDGNPYEELQDPTTDAPAPDAEAVVQPASEHERIVVLLGNDRVLDAYTTAGQPVDVLLVDYDVDEAGFSAFEDWDHVRHDNDGDAWQGIVVAATPDAPVVDGYFADYRQNKDA